MQVRVLVFAVLTLGTFACSRADAPSITAVPAPEVSATPPPVVVAEPAPSAPPGSTVKPKDAEREMDDVREATFRHMFAKNASGQQQKAKVYCLDLENATPAPADLIARFRDVKAAVKPGSACDSDPEKGVIERATGKHGLKFRVSSIRFLDADHAMVGGGYYEAGLSASGNTYTLERKAGRWVVTKDELNWIS